MLKLATIGLALVTFCALYFSAEGALSRMACPEGRSATDVWRPNVDQCEECYCHSDSQATCETCGSVHHEDDWEKQQDMSKPYPQCCPEWIPPPPPTLPADLEALFQKWLASQKGDKK